MSSSWSKIPTDLLYSILSKLSIPDIFRSAAVCSSWSAVVDEVGRWPDDQHPQIPWLVPELQIDRNVYHFLSLSEGRVYDIPSGDPRNVKKVIGSSHGWLINIDKINVQLLNPITGAQIDLPSIPTMDDRNLHAMKAVLSSDPSRSGDYIVVFVFYSFSIQKEFLFSVSAGDEEWKMISGGAYYYDDVAFHKGKLYAVSQAEEEVGQVMVAAYDLIALDSTPTGTPVVALPDIVLDADYVGHSFCTTVNDLLIVRFLTNEYNQIKKLEVWKVDTEKGGIIPVNYLGKYALFLSEESSLCLDTSSLPKNQNLKSNSVYISMDFFVNLVYNMEDESFTSFSLPPLSFPEMQEPTLLWFTPNLLHDDPM
ncbi:putative F-box protein At5g66830 [Zingiber officinale]|uniref:putative F-box protein At5g66830 n=1 Tax=Zingiber officinale TaxID=94328 RepID=UPI001C4B4086|nr:putative F-box protein At5g66830 [Zingiber officinale]